VTSDEALSRTSGSDGAAGVTGVVVVAHGGQSESTEPTAAFQPAVLRMVPVARAIRQALRGQGAVVCRPRFELRGWNGDLASPVADLSGFLDWIGSQFGPVPIVLVGHSMGGRAAFRVAGHPSVSAVAGLAPWLPPTEPVEQLAGRRVLLVHGSADRVTSPAQTWAYAERARAVAKVATIEINNGEHTMLRRAGLWHEIAAEFTRLALGLPAGNTDVDAAINGTAADYGRTIL
jgi:pimeloyl-ACP methyl ester carboxylesterase